MIMMKPGDKVIVLNDAWIWDTTVRLRSVDASHTKLEDAVADAKARATSPNVDAVVLEEGDRFVVGTIAELTAPDAVARQLNDAVPGVVAVLAGVGKGVRLRGTQDRSSHFDLIATVLGKAGLAPSDIEAVLRNGVSAEQAHDLVGKLMSGPTRSSGYGPRLAALSVLREISAGHKRCAAAQLLRSLQRYQPLVVVQPDGYLTRMADGKAIQHAGARSYHDRSIHFGPYEVGKPYHDASGVVFPIDERLRPAGSPLGELGLEAPLGERVAMGAAQALVETVDGLAQLLRDPIRSINDLRHLPAALSALVESSPEYWDRFQTLPLGDQAQELSRLTSHLTMIMAGGVGVAKTVATTGNMAKLTVPVLQLGRDGTLAYALATVSAGAEITALSGLPGAVYVLHMTQARLPDPNDVSANSKRWHDHAEKKGWSKPGAGVEAAGPEHIAAHAARRAAPARIESALLRKMQKLVGKADLNKFTAALHKGIVGPKGESGIKALVKPHKGFTHELKIGGSGQRILGRMNEQGDLVFSEFIRGGLH